MMAPNVSGAFRAVSTAKNPSTIAVTAMASRTTAAFAPVSARRRYCREIDQIGHEQHQPCGDEQAGLRSES